MKEEYKKKGRKNKGNKGVFPILITTGKGDRNSLGEINDVQKKWMNL